MELRFDDGLVWLGVDVVLEIELSQREREREKREIGEREGKPRD